MITLKHITDICKKLNNGGVKYTLIGGCAIFIHGFERTTKDIDMLVEDTAENIDRIKKALAEILPEACAELEATDLQENVVVRMVGEDVIVDLMGHVGDVDYKATLRDIDENEINGVPIPVAGLDTMLELKKGVRDADKRDYLFLKGKKEYLERKGKG